MTDNNRLSRRSFLNNVSTVVTGAATGLVLTKANAIPSQLTDIQPEKDTLPPKAKGYQRTEHVDTYYKLADF